MAENEIGRKVRLTLLSAFYGPMLTEKQQRVLSLFCEEDMGITEIAAEENVTKQAIHEQLRGISSKLEQLEGKLGLAERFSKIEDSLERCRAAIEEERTGDALEIIDSIIKLNQEDEDGV